MRRSLLAGLLAGLFALGGVACEADPGPADDPLVDDPATDDTFEDDTLDDGTTDG